MFRNSIKEVGEPSLGAVSLARRDSLTELHEIIRSSSVDGYVSRQRNLIQEINSNCTI